MDSKLILLLLCFTQLVWAQEHAPQVQKHEEQGVHATADSSKTKSKEVKSLKDFFLKGKVHGHLRNYFMATINEGGGNLNDYWTNATGGAIKYQTACFKGFQFGVKGIFTFKTFSDDLNRVDSISGKTAKWEKELYDVTRPSEGIDLDRLEELYIRYNHKSSFLTYGRIDINEGPLLLRRDGRMKPFVFMGFWGEIKELKNHDFYIGWLHGVSPRGVAEWYSLSEVMGLFNNGYLPNGNHAHYHEHIKTKGMGVLGYKNRSVKGLELQFWNYYFNKINNTIWTQVDYESKRWFVGGQYVTQFTMPYQQQLAYENRYCHNGISHTMSYQAGFKIGDFGRIGLAYLHGFGTGKFLFPRELGRENFYVSHPRSWVDGFGAVDMFVFKTSFRFFEKKYWEHLSLDLLLARVQVPDQHDYSQNKYGIASYYQGTLNLKYNLPKVLRGTEIMLLYIARFTEDNQGLDLNEKFYRTNFHHFNFIINFDF